ncbi:MAG TPA: CHRD domain-containing protein [Bryobacteraceae bacterium]|nr:CHRD domain-containing protein [Bryobacteraceae bacterium]
MQKINMGFPRRAAILFLPIAFVLSLAAQGDNIKARLSPVPADARTRTELAGTGSASASMSGTKLVILGSFEGLLSPATTASLHAAVTAGVRGPAISSLTVSNGTSGTISGSVELTPAQLANMRKGGLYIQIQSEKFPDGVLWGWLLR